MPDLGAARIADGDYMSAWEFAQLTVSQQCDVWAAVERGRVRWIAVRSIRCYHRADVQALLGGVTRG